MICRPTSGSIRVILVGVLDLTFRPIILFRQASVLAERKVCRLQILFTNFYLHQISTVFSLQDRYRLIFSLNFPIVLSLWFYPGLKWCFFRIWKANELYIGMHFHQFLGQIKLTLAVIKLDNYIYTSGIILMRCATFEYYV